MAHHRQFHYIKHSYRTLVWINIIFLMATCLLPFSTSLLAEYREQQISIFVYGGNSIIIALHSMVVCYKPSRQISRRKFRPYCQTYVT